MAKAKAVEQIRCPEGHTTIWKVGTVPTRAGPKVRYKCRTCARSFYYALRTEPVKRVRKPRVKSAKKAG